MRKKAKFNKFKKVLEDIFYNGNLKRYKITPYEATEAAEDYNSIVENNQVETISEGVKNLFEKYGFTAVQHGIGWRITA